MTATYRMSARTRWVGVVLSLVVAVVYLTTAAYSATHVDTTSANVGSWRIATTGGPALDGIDVDTLHDAQVPLFSLERADGHTVIVRSPGVVAAGVPAYLIDAVLTGGGTDEADYSDVPGVVTAALLTTLAVLFLWLALLPRLGPRAATVAAAAFALATPMWSVAANGLWPHTVTCLGITGMAWAASRERWWLVGVFGGIAVWGRLHTVLITAALALAIAWARREPRVAVVVGTIGAVFTGLASLWTHWVWGGWVPTGGYDVGGYVGQYDDGSPRFADSVWGVLENEAGLFVAADRGLLVWTPLVLVLLPALVRSWNGQPVWTRALLVGGLAYTVVQGTLNVFDGGDGIYGYRLTLELLATAAPALAHAAAETGRVARRLVGPVIGLQVVAIGVGATVDRFSVSREDVWVENSFITAAATAPALLVLATAGAITGALVQRVLGPSPAAPAERRPDPMTVRARLR